MYKAAIFDLDGTVADTLESIAEACNKTLIRFGLSPLKIGRYRYFAGNGADTLIERTLRAAGDERLLHYEQVYEAYMEIFKQDCTYKVKAFDGMKDVLDSVKMAGIKIAVVTNKPHDSAVKVVEYLFGSGYFDRILGAGKGFPKKPDPAGTLSVAAELNAGPAECLYVGDTNVDMQTGRNAGMYTAGVLWGFRSREELEENHAQAIVEKPEDILRLLL